MRPALSLILFTTLSGMGFGLAAVIGAGLLTPASPFWWIVANGFALGLIGLGLAASTFHLGHPERAWRAFSQWRTSWLSREGVLATVTGITIIIWAGAVLLEVAPALWPGAIVAVLALVTVWATAMIYASLKTVARWHHLLTAPMFITYAIAGGLIAGAMIESFNGENSVLRIYAIIAGAVSIGIGISRDYFAGRKGSGSSPESATGLGNLGKVEMLMPPHTEENWLQHEMGFVVARKHAKVLRRAGYALSIAALIAIAASGASMVMIFATLLHLAGVMILRWLFFAEAKHTVTLYYGERH